MENFTCTVCEQVFNPEKGESQQNIPFGRDFFTLPDDCQSLICGASEQHFSKE